ATGAPTGPTFTLTGAPHSFDLVSADGTLALITTHVPDQYQGNGTTRVSVIDTTTGNQLGTTLTIPGSGDALLSADGTHALIITAVYDSAAWITDPHSTGVAVIDTTTGKQIGATFTMPGAIYGAQLLNADGTNVL